MYRANATTAAAVAEKKVVVASCFRPSIFFNRTIGGKRRGKKERRGREGRKGKIFFDNAFRFDRKQKKEEKDRWNPDSYCIESQSLTGKKIETNPSNSIRVGSPGRNNGFSWPMRCTRLGNPFSTCNFKRNTKRYGSLRRAL